MHSLLIVIVLLSFDGNEAGLVRRYASSGQELLIPVAVITDDVNNFPAADFNKASTGKEGKVQAGSIDSAVPSVANDFNPADVSIQENEVRDVYVNKLYEQQEEQLPKNVKLQQQQQQQEQQEKQSYEEKPSKQSVKSGENTVVSFVESSNQESVADPSTDDTSAIAVKKADTFAEQEQQPRLSTVDPIATTEGSPELPVASVADTDGKTIENQDVTQLRQNNQAAPVQTTPGNFVQQLLQNSPFRPIFNQFTGQNAQTANDETSATTSAPALPGFFNPIQTVVNTTTQAFQGLQHFASNLGNQFQNTFSNLGGQGQQAQQQGQDGVASTSRPPGPIQQFVSNFIGGNPGNQQQQTQSQPQRPLQNIFQGIFQGNRPQQATANTNKPANSDNPDSQASNQPAELSTLAAETAGTAGDVAADPAGAVAGAGDANDSNPIIDPIDDDKNKRHKVPAEDSFEDGDSEANEEAILVNDDAAQTVNHHHYFHHQYDRPDGSYPSDPGYSAAVPY